MPIRADQAILTCLLRRAIQRSDRALAEHAAASLFALKGRGVWTRLRDIAFAEIGNGDRDLLREAARVCGDQSYRNRIGLRRAATELAGRMAQAPKERSAAWLAISTGCRAPSLTPSVWAAMQGAPPARILIRRRLPQVQWVGQLPMYAIGPETRIGREAARLFSLQCEPVARFLTGEVPAFSRREAAYLAADYVDLFVKRELIWAGAAEIKRKGIEAHFGSIGVAASIIGPLLALYAENTGLLHEIRARLLKSNGPDIAAGAEAHQIAGGVSATS